MSRFVCSKTWLWLTDSHICTWTFMLTLWLNDPVTHTVIYIQCLSHTHSHTLMRPIWREAGLWCSEPLRESAVFSRFFSSQHSMNLCVSRRFGITWDMSHVPSRRRPLNFCKACENLSCHWSGLVFTLLWIVSKSPVCSQEEPENLRNLRVWPQLQASHTRPSRCHSFHFLQSKVMGVSGPAEGQVQPAGMLSFPAACWCVVWLVLTGMWLCKS